MFTNWKGKYTERNWVKSRGIISNKNSLPIFLTKKILQLIYSGLDNLKNLRCQRTRQKPLSSNRTRNYIYHLLLHSWTDSKFCISPHIAVPFTYKIASLCILPHCNEHAMKWLWIPDGASRDRSILIFSHSAGREMHWLQHTHLLQLHQQLYSRSVLPQTVGLPTCVCL